MLGVHHWLIHCGQGVHDKLTTDKKHEGQACNAAAALLKKKRK